MPIDWDPPPELTDSKDMKPHELRSVFTRCINDDRLIVGVAAIYPEDIDRVGIDAAQAMAQGRAVQSILPKLDSPPLLIVDGVLPPAIGAPLIRHFICVPKADLLVPAVSLASVFAKANQLAFMVAYDEMFPEYGFGKHHGYGSKAHKAALKLHGPCAIHRKTYRPVAEALAEREDDTADRELWMMFDED